MATDAWIELPVETGGGSGVSSINGETGAINLLPGTGITITPSGQNITIAATGGGGSGTVTSVSVVSANGFAGTVATSTTTPAITLSTTVSGILFGNGTSVAAAVAGNFPTLNQSTTGTAANITATSNSTLTTLSALSLPYSQITGAPPTSGFTQGSVLFANSAGQISQDNANFFWNDTTFNLGLGVIPATTVTLDTVNSTGTSKAIQTTSYGAGSTIPFRGRFARGTSGTPAAAQSGDSLSTLSGRGYGTSQFAAASTGAINMVAGETFTNASNATYIQFEVTPTGSVTVAEAMRLNSTGNLLIGTTTDSGTQKLQVNGNSNVGTVTAGVWNGTATSGDSFITTGLTYTTPSNITTNTQFKFTLIGGGAGGASSNTASEHSPCGGSGGGLILFTSGLSPSTAYNINIGSFGTGGTSATTGTAGGATTLVIGVTTYTAGGGNAAAAITGPGGTGGTATNGTINIPGGQGGAAMGVFTSGGLAGANSPFGFGFGGAGNAASVAAVGNPGTGFGSGGGGSSSNGGNAGGNGTQGCILVEWQN